MTSRLGITHTSKMPGSNIQGSFGMFQFLVGIKTCPNYTQEFCNRIKHLGFVHSYPPPPTLPYLLISFLRIAEMAVMQPN